MSNDFKCCYLILNSMKIWKRAVNNFKYGNGGREQKRQFCNFYCLKIIFFLDKNRDFSLKGYHR